MHVIEAKKYLAHDFGDVFLVEPIPLDDSVVQLSSLKVPNF